MGVTPSEIRYPFITLIIITIITIVTIIYSYLIVITVTITLGHTIYNIKINNNNSILIELTQSCDMIKYKDAQPTPNRAFWSRYKKSIKCPMILRNPSEKLRPIFTYKCQMINIKIFYSILQGVPPKKWVLLLVIVAVNPTFFWDTLYKGYMCVGKSNIYAKNWPHILVKFKRILEPHSSQRMSDRYQSKGDEINIIMTSLFMIS